MEYLRGKLLQFSICLIALPALAIDIDNDGLDDSVETNTGFFVSALNAGTNPAVADSDTDGFIDGLEVSFGTDPTQFGSSPIYTSHTASDADADDSFGYSVAVDGDTAVMGAYYDNERGTYAGAAYIFRREAGSWSQVQKLLPNVGSEYSRFGTSVAIQGDTIAIGGPGARRYSGPSGPQATYVYNFNGIDWVEQQVLTSNDMVSGDAFGSGVAVSEQTIAIGASGEGNSGAVYSFDWDGSAWVETQKLRVGGYQNSFGQSVDMQGDILIGGNPFDDDSGEKAGAAIVYERINGIWVFSQKFTASDGSAQDRFGQSVAISGETVVIGAYLEDDNIANSGSVYIFRRVGSNWFQAQKLFPDDQMQDDHFGYYVDIDDHVVLVGAYQHDDIDSNSGAAYVYTRNADTWSLQKKIITNDYSKDNHLGMSVALDGNTALLGAPGKMVGVNSAAGTVYFLDLEIEPEPFVVSIPAVNFYQMLLLAIIFIAIFVARLHFYGRIEQ